MPCPKCNATTDADAAFCIECGAEVSSEAVRPKAKDRKVYLYTLLLVPVIVIAVAVGYYKYFLPRGVAAVVNGEEIMLSELDAAVAAAAGPREKENGKFRYQMLNRLISERLVLQEASKAGVGISREETKTALALARSSSGLSEEAFAEQAAAQYGSMSAFEETFRRRLLINKFLAEKVMARDAGPEASQQAVNRWMQDVSGRASVRITLAEQLSAASCGCCNNRGSAWASEKGGSHAANKGRIDARSADAEKASAAALAYWNDKYGADRVTANVEDFGCHFEVDIIRDDKKIGSLRYQGGRISEE